MSLVEFVSSPLLLDGSQGELLQVRVSTPYPTQISGRTIASEILHPFCLRWVSGVNCCKYSARQDSVELLQVRVSTPSPRYVSGRTITSEGLHPFSWICLWELLQVRISTPYPTQISGRTIASEILHPFCLRWVSGVNCCKYSARQDSVELLQVRVSTHSARDGSRG